MKQRQTVIPGQKKLFEDELSLRDTTSTFSPNLSLPIHRWFRYSAGFSAQWVREVIQREKAYGRNRVVDPFAGSGTVLLESEYCNVESMGIEAHPFIARIAKAKLCWNEDPVSFRKYALSILERAKQLRPEPREYSKLTQKCFSPESLSRLDALLQAWNLEADESPISELTWLALASIVRECSHVGTAQWQYVLPRKTKARVLDPFDAYEIKVHLMSQDMTIRQKQKCNVKAKLFREDARSCYSIPDKWAELIITSPPYANNYDYADATRLEMSFFGDIASWGDLQSSVRKYLIRSCTQHVAKDEPFTYRIVDDPLLKPIHDELFEVCKKLDAERLKHGGKKPYHTMIASYFRDMARIWKALRRISAQDSLACFVVGDSAPYGIYVPVDRWIGELALSAGFHSYEFEKIRDRNVKWKNRKHRVPLHEGRLWIKG